MGDKEWAKRQAEEISKLPQRRKEEIRQALKVTLARMEAEKEKQKKESEK